jgi:protease-4
VPTRPPVVAAVVGVFVDGLLVGLLALAFLASLLAASPAWAQTAPELRPTRGPFITDAARAGDADATAVELNPGSLGLLPAGDLQLVGAAAGESTSLGRRGAGLYWGAPVFSGSALGLGLTWVAGAPEVGIDRHTTFRLAYALRLGRGAAIGAAWAHIWGGAFGGTNTFDLGLSLRLGRFVGIGATIEDVGTPTANGAPVSLPRLWNGELVLRPLGTDRLEIAAGAAHAGTESWHDVAARARLSVLLIRGLRLYGEGEAFPTAAGRAFQTGSGGYAGLGLALDFDHLGVLAGVYANQPGGMDWGTSVAARVHVSGERSPPLAAPAYVARVSFDRIHDDREFVALVERLRGLAVDPGCLGVLFKIEEVDLGLARIEELRGLMAFLRASGKKTFAYAPSPSTKSYYLATAADAVLLHPAGELAITGLAQNVTFYKGAMDRLGVHVDLVRIGAFKGAMEPYVMTEQSPDVRANKNLLLDDVFARLCAQIADDRSRAGHRMDAAEVKVLVDRGIFTPGEAQLVGLADGVVAEGDIEPLLAKLFHRANIRVRDPDPSPLAPGFWPGRRIAVVLVDGTITDGPNQELPFGLGSFAGSDTLASALEECRRDPTVGAVVLRVNSPGGSAFASDVLARGIVKLREAGKPVVVSMGDLAASGGYYISAPADVIYAEPSTVTGSIGIFGFKVDVGRLMNLLGVSVETYRRGTHADYQSPYRPWSEAELKLAMDQIRHLYELFVDTVATGRKSRGLTAGRVDELGRGQVWTGALAESFGLVDRMGGVSEAIDEAARAGRAPLGPDHLPQIVVLPRPPGGLLGLLSGLATEAAGEGAAATPQPVLTPAALATPEGRAAARLLAPLFIGGGSGYLARLPFDIDLR